MEIEDSWRDMMEEEDRPRSLDDLRVVAEHLKKRAIRNLLVAFVLVVVSGLVLFGVSLPEIIQNILSLVVVFSVVGFGASLSNAVVALRNDVTRLPYTFSEKLRLSLRKLVGELKTYARCTAPATRNQRGPRVRKHLRITSDIIRTWGGAFETGYKENLDLLTEDLLAFSETVSDLLQRINYLVKRREKVHHIAIDALTVLSGGLEDLKDVRSYIEVFERKAKWVAGQGREKVDNEFTYSVVSVVGERLGEFYQKSGTVFMTVFALVNIGLLYAIAVQTSVQFLSMSLDDNSIFTGFIIALSAAGIPLYLALKRR